MAYKVLQSAIEAGDADGVRFLVKSSRLCIAIDEVVCIYKFPYEETKATPFELSSSLRHYDVTKVFIAAGADLNKSYQHGKIGGTMNHACYRQFPRDHCYWLQGLNLELISLLLSAGAIAKRGHPMHQVWCMRKEIELFEKVLAAPSSAHLRWLQQGQLHRLALVIWGRDRDYDVDDHYDSTAPKVGNDVPDLFMPSCATSSSNDYSTDGMLLSLVQTMTAVSKNIDDFRPNNSPCILDIMVSRRCMSAAKHLIDSGYCPTLDTINAAWASQFHYDDLQEDPSELMSRIFSHDDFTPISESDCTIESAYRSHQIESPTDHGVIVTTALTTPDSTNDSESECGCEGSSSAFITPSESLIGAIRQHDQQLALQLVEEYAMPGSWLSSSEMVSKKLLCAAMECQNSAIV